MSAQERYEELKFEMQRCQQVLDEARKVFERSNPETREIRHVRKAERLLDEAFNRFMQAQDVLRQEAIWDKQEEQRQARREPPSLQKLVLAYGTYDRITPEAWAKFDADMAEWKAKIRAGEFDAKIWR
jgi:hypothetical protein